MLDKPHKNLNAWKYSFGFVKDIYIVTTSFPSAENFGIISQLRRASVSVPTNIAEGAARKSYKEFLYFLNIALGSVSELDTLILLSKQLEFINSDVEDMLLKKLDIIGKLIHGLMKSIGNRI